MKTVEKMRIEGFSAVFTVFQFGTKGLGANAEKDKN